MVREEIEDKGRFSDQQSQTPEDMHLENWVIESEKRICRGPVGIKFQGI